MTTHACRVRLRWSAMAFLWSRPWYQRTKPALLSFRALISWWESNGEFLDSLNVVMNVVLICNPCTFSHAGDGEFEWADRNTQLAAVWQKHCQLFHVHQGPHHVESQVSFLFESPIFPDSKWRLSSGLQRKVELLWNNNNAQSNFNSRW